MYGNIIIYTERYSFRDCRMLLSFPFFLLHKIYTSIQNTRWYRKHIFDMTILLLSSKSFLKKKVHWIFDIVLQIGWMALTNFYAVPWRNKFCNLNFLFCFLKLISHSFEGWWVRGFAFQSLLFGNLVFHTQAIFDASSSVTEKMNL